jgi:beta-phosphoglucomutase-like phosphatase (HAD superfamily)
MREKRHKSLIWPRWLLAVASGSERAVIEAVLDLGDLRRHFSVVVSASEVAHGKPAPDIFLLAAERIGLSPDVCLVAEDAPSGLRAARAAGCAALGVRSSFDDATLREAGAFWTVQDLAEACGLLPLILDGASA